MQGVLRHREQVAAASGLDVLAGIWLLISPFVLGFNELNLTNATTNNVIVGLCVAVLAAIRAFGAYRHSWISWINAVLGLWTLLTPWILGFSEYRTPSINNIVLGVIIIVLACWSALASSSDMAVSRPGMRSPDRIEPPSAI